MHIIRMLPPTGRQHGLHVPQHLNISWCLLFHVARSPCSPLTSAVWCVTWHGHPLPPLCLLLALQTARREGDGCTHDVWWQCRCVPTILVRALRWGDGRCTHYLSVGSGGVCIQGSDCAVHISSIVLHLHSFYSN